MTVYIPSLPELSAGRGLFCFMRLAWRIKSYFAETRNRLRKIKREDIIELLRE